jgi:dihydroxy-acid dehydratase
MPEPRSRTVNMAGARALSRAAGVEREDFGKPIVAVAAAAQSRDDALSS